ncbi:hypothetical protein [Knoellia sp. p5-6-4]|uniref:hypothetical protein n=1 Tax=unclassified Knoellia TaxID=2618719 RepID=UPI0023D99007|nr:hypothetical protein [Knoellia sp. p5-6-4]MDF2146742.1 hypothetical protein [Knoellia sp. p5-6-4]
MSALRWAGFAVMAAFGGFTSLMLVGYTVTDVGGWEAIGLIAAVGVPLGLLCLLAWLRPSVAVPVLAVVSLVPIAFGVLQLLDYGRWSDWEDQNGPVGLVLVLIVGVALAVLGLSRPAEAGALLLAIVVVPLVLSMVGAGDQWARPLSIALVLVPAVVSGVLFLLAARTGSAEQSSSGASRFAH